MADDKPQPQAAAPEGTAPVQPDPEGWLPRVDNGLQINTNPFEKFDYSGKSPSSEAVVNPRMTIQDPTRDTAPLQGTRDISDDDHLG